MRPRLAILLVLVAHPTASLRIPLSGAEKLRRSGAVSPRACQATADEASADRTLDREMRSIAGPALINTLLDPFLSVVDTAWVSRLGTLALGATAASSELFTLTIAASLALRESASSTIARLQARKLYHEARLHARRTLQLALLTGCGLAVVISVWAPAACGLMGCPVGSPLHENALSYVRARALGLPFALCISASEGIFRGLGDTAAPLRAALVASLVNIVLDPILMLHPCSLGVAGVALATTIAQAIAAFLLLRTLQTNLFAQGVGASRTTAKEPKGQAPAEAAAAAARLAGTTLATLLRTCSVIFCWVFIASTISRRLGPTAIAAHGVVLKMWLLLVLAAEAPAVAGQVLSARAISAGDLPRARRLLRRLCRQTIALGFAQAVGMAALAGPATAFLVRGDPATAEMTRRLFYWAAAVTPLVAPNALLEAVLLGTGRSYKFLAFRTLASALMIGAITRWAIISRPVPSSAWACILVFFVLRLSTSASRVFRSPRGGFGDWDADADHFNSPQDDSGGVTSPREATRELTTRNAALPGPEAES